MTNEELIEYCDSHCESSQTLFLGRDINRMVSLAGLPNAYSRLQDEQWVAMGKAMKNLCAN